MDDKGGHQESLTYAIAARKNIDYLGANSQAVVPREYGEEIRSDASSVF